MSAPEHPEPPEPPLNLGEAERDFDAFVDETLDPNYIEVDPLAPHYRETITQAGRPQHSLEHQHAALLCIDLQYLDASKEHGVFGPERPKSLTPEAQDYYFKRLERVVLPNVRALQDTFRQYGLEVIHTRIQSLTQDGRDRSPGHKRLELHAAPGSREAEFLDEVAPLNDEIIINKTASGMFTSTNARYVLNNLGVTSLFVVGVYTNECVSTTVRDGCDLGFDVTLIEDACGTVSRKLHRNTVDVLRDRYARVMTTSEVVAEVSTHGELVARVSPG